MTEFFIKNATQKKNLIHHLEEAIKWDCEEGRMFLKRKRESPIAEELSEGVLSTIEKNIEVREAIYRATIKTLEGKFQFPLTLHDVYNQLLLNIATADIPKDYKDLVLATIPPSKMPPEIIHQILALSGDEVLTGCLVVPGSEVTHETAEIIRLRSKTMEIATHAVFDAFYCAATSAQNPDKRSPKYKEFCALVNKMLGHEGGHGGPP